MKFSIKEVTPAWIKDNLSLIILVPAILGGLWQLLELASIGIPYIRFFSVSQIVSDGLLILFMAITIFILIRLMMYGEKRESESSRNNQTPTEQEKNKSTKEKLDKSWYNYVAIALLLFITLVALFIFPIIKSITANYRAKFHELIGITVV